MTRVVLWLLPAATLLGAVLGGAVALPTALALAVVLGMLLGFGAWSWQRRRLDRLVDEVSSWVGERGYRPVDLRGGRSWAHLATAVNALGAAHHRQAGQLRDAQPRLVELVNAIPGPALLFSVQGQVVAANDPGRALFGVPRDEVTSVTQALGSADLIAAVQRSSAQHSREAVTATVGGRHLSIVVAPLAGHALLLAEDRTDRRRTEALRRDFVSNASHELKTPVAGIQALSDAIDVTLERDPARARRLAAQLRREADRMAALVHDLLSLGRLEDEDVRVEAEPVDVTRVAAEALADVVDAADDRGIDLELTGEERAMVLAAPDDLRLVVTNLVDNAVKYNRDHGKVIVDVARDGGAVVIAVRDTGIGIPSEDVSRVFERFYRVDEGRSREAGGTGLGLSIVRNAVERHGGQVTVESLLGAGSTFRVRWPAA